MDGFVYIKRCKYSTHIYTVLYAYQRISCHCEQEQLLGNGIGGWQLVGQREQLLECASHAAGGQEAGAVGV